MTEKINKNDALSNACFAGVNGQLALLRTGKITSAELIEAHLDRIERFDPALNAFSVVFRDEARKYAAQADARRKAGHDVPLLGVPIALKEDTAVAGLPTTMGTDAVIAIAADDAEVVSRLRRAGAVVLGRTRAPELCLWPFTETAHAGPTRNPWSLDHSPGGSSGGAAAAVAGGLAAAALGSDGGGSIRMPSAATGLFGLKPQRGRISLAPHAEVWTGLSVVGPLTRTVSDAATLMDVLQGSQPGDRHRAVIPAMPFVEAASQQPGTLRIGVSLRPWPIGGRIHHEVREAVHRTARALSDLGHDVSLTEPPLVDPTAMFSYGPRFFRSLVESVAAVDEPQNLSKRVQSLHALGRRYPDRIVAAAHRYSDRIVAKVNTVFEKVDVLLCPVTPRPALRVGELYEENWIKTLLGAQQYTAYMTLWNLVGNPAASVPAGFTEAGLPLGVQIVGRPHDEATLLALAGQMDRMQSWAQNRPDLT
ncbi:amidase [Streptomyces sp. NPDC047072]|uniref:amidase n=1 Tax=Streptomyces sp. NPDC047072 TaxID=3154809 RepID=UPI0033DA78F3